MKNIKVWIGIGIFVLLVIAMVIIRNIQNNAGALNMTDEQIHYMTLSESKFKIDKMAKMYQDSDQFIDPKTENKMRLKKFTN